MATYRTFIAEIDHEFRMKKQDSPGVTQFAQVAVRIVPRDTGIVIRVDESLADVVKPWKAALLRGLQAAISKQSPPVDGFEVRVTAIETHPRDTNEFAVENCARLALLDAFAAGNLVERDYGDN